MEEENRILRILSNPTRFKILKRLIKSPDYTTNLSKKLYIESSIITKALKKIEKEGLVSTFRDKKLKYYKIKDKFLLDKLKESITKVQ